MPPVPVQTRWWALRLRDASIQRDMSFPKELIVPALNAGGLNIQRGEFRFRAGTVDVLFQTSTRRRKAVDAFKNWAPTGTDGPHRPIWVEWDPIWPNLPPFRATDESHYAIHRIRRELERLIRDDEAQSDDEAFEGVVNEEAIASEGSIAEADYDEDEDENEGYTENLAEHASCPMCGANRSARGRS